MNYTATTKNLRALFSLVAMMILFPVVEARASWGDFDTSFGFQGVTVDPITGYFPLSTAIQPDGKILVTGYRTTDLRAKGFFLRRYLSDGQLDTSFGTNGAALGPEVNSYGTDFRGYTIVVQANGKIAVAGWANGSYGVWQFSSTGIKDKTFGQNGLLRLTSYPAAGYPELNIQSGKLLLSIPKQDGSNYSLVLVRLTSIGALDVTFGNSGESLTGVNGGKGSGTVVEPDGKITIGGGKFDDPNTKGLERKLANGQNDPTFSAPPPNFSFGIILPGLVKMANAKYAIRTGNLGNGITFYLERANAVGVFDGAISPYSGWQGYGCPEIFANQNDGKLLAQAGGLIFRLNPDFDGPIESNSCSNLNGISGFARAAIQADDKMVVAGIYNNYLMLARLMPN